MLKKIVIKKTLGIYFTIYLLSALLLLYSSCASNSKNGKKTLDESASPTVKTETTAQRKETKKNIQPPEPQKDLPIEVVFANKIRAALASGDMSAALALFDNMPKELENDTDLQLVHASILVSAGKNNEARHIVSELSKKDANNVDLLEMSMVIAKSSGDENAARAAADKILKVDPNHAGANISRAENLAMKRQYKQAGNAYRRALTNDKNNTGALFGYAQMMYYQNNLKESENYLTRLLEVDPENSYALAYMGKLAAEDENYLRASRYIKQAIDIENDNYDFYVDYGTYEHYQGHYDEAMSAWTKAINLRPDYFLAYGYRAGLYEERNKLREALSDFQNVVRTNPDYYYAYEEIGILHWHFGEWAAARKAFQQALTYAKDNYAYILMVAASYLKEKNNAEAKSYLARAMRNFNRESLEYQVLRLFHDQGGVNAENSTVNLVGKEQNTTKRGKLRYYLALYFELKGNSKIADELYTQVASIKAPMFFEYRLAEWAIGS